MHLGCIGENFTGSGDEPKKEMALHSAFYDTRRSAGAVVYLHSCHSVPYR